MRTKICPQCNLSFTSSNLKSRVYCSIKCSSTARWGLGRSGTCKNCGITTRFRTKYEKLGYCTKVCFDEVNSTLSVNRSSNQFVCMVCHKPYYSKRKNVGICSIRCAAFHRESLKKTKIVQQIFHCLFCNKKIKTTNKTQSFCNGTCSLKNLALIRTGKKRSIEDRVSISQSKKGKLNPSWRGGVTVERVKLRNNIEYKTWRVSVFEKDNYTCTLCGARSGNGKKIVLNADHIIPWWKSKKQRFDVNNGQTLCSTCHKLKTIEELKLGWINQYTSAQEVNRMKNAQKKR